LDIQNNYVERLSVDDTAAKYFNILATRLSISNNYFNGPNKIIFRCDVAKFLDTSIKWFFPCSESLHALYIWQRDCRQINQIYFMYGKRSLTLQIKLYFRELSRIETNVRWADVTRCEHPNWKTADAVWCSPTPRGISEASRLANLNRLANLYCTFRPSLAAVTTKI